MPIAGQPVRAVHALWNPSENLRYLLARTEKGQRQLAKHAEAKPPYPASVATQLEFELVLLKFHWFGEPVASDAPRAQLPCFERIARCLVIRSAVQRQPCSH